MGRGPSPVRTKTVARLEGGSTVGTRTKVRSRDCCTCLRLPSDKGAASGFAEPALERSRQKVKSQQRWQCGPSQGERRDDSLRVARHTSTIGRGGIGIPRGLEGELGEWPRRWCGKGRSLTGERISLPDVFARLTAQIPKPAAAAATLWDNTDSFAGEQLMLRNKVFYVCIRYNNARQKESMHVGKKYFSLPV